MPKATAHAKYKLFYHFRRYFIRARARCAKRWYNYVNTKCITRKINFLCTTIHDNSFDYRDIKYLFCLEKISNLM